MTRYQGSVSFSSLILVIAIFILVGLGGWQLSRMQEKQTYLADIAAKREKPARELLDLIDMQQAAPNVWTVVSGKLAEQWVWLVDNRQHQQKIGYQVFAVLNTSAGPLLVDMGWVAATGERDNWPKVPLPSALINAKGVITEPSVNPFVNVEMFESKPNQVQTVFRVQGIDIEQQSNQTGLALLPFTVTLTESDADFVRSWQPVVMPPEKHLAYAIQWFGLAVAAAIIGFRVITKSRRSNGGV